MSLAPGATGGTVSSLDPMSCAIEGLICLGKGRSGGNINAVLDGADPGFGMAGESSRSELARAAKMTIVGSAAPILGSSSKLVGSV